MEGIEPQASTQPPNKGPSAPAQWDPGTRMPHCFQVILFQKILITNESKSSAHSFSFWTQSTSLSHISDFGYLKPCSWSLPS